jgi:viroplasmin and RNaseH domain-containing protein
MGPCYVVFYGKEPEIYSSWHEASEYVLGVRHARHKKYNNYGDALRAFNAYVGQQLAPHGEVGGVLCPTVLVQKNN